jgi:hypothetical protein
VGEDEVPVLERHPEHGVGQRFFDDTVYFDGLFFSQFPS